MVDFGKIPSPKIRQFTIDFPWKNMSQEGVATISNVDFIRMGASS